MIRLECTKGKEKGKIVELTQQQYDAGIEKGMLGIYKKISHVHDERKAPSNERSIEKDEVVKSLEDIKSKKRN